MYTHTHMYMCMYNYYTVYISIYVHVHVHVRSCTDFGRHGDPTDSLACYQASLEARCYGNLEESRFLWDDVMGRHGREARFWIQYAEMEL